MSQPKINRHFLKSAPNNCPVIIRGRDSYDEGTCGNILFDGHICSVHKDVTPLIEAPLPEGHEAEYVWFVRKDAWDGAIVASASEEELRKHGLMTDTAVKTTKGEWLPLSEFKTIIGTERDSVKHPFCRQYTKDLVDRKYRLRVVIF